MTIRAATLEDINEVHLICREFQAISPYSSHMISDEKFYEFLEFYLTPKPEEHMVLVYETEGDIQGILAGIMTVGSHFFSESRVATELVWFVREEHRRGMAPIRLLRAYEAWAKLMGASKVSLTAVDNKHREMLTQMYKKLGYKSTEETFVREL